MSAGIGKHESTAEKMELKTVLFFRERGAGVDIDITLRQQKNQQEGKVP